MLHLASFHATRDVPRDENLSLVCSKTSTWTCQTLIALFAIKHDLYSDMGQFQLTHQFMLISTTTSSMNQTFRWTPPTLQTFSCSTAHFIVVDSETPNLYAWIASFAMFCQSRHYYDSRCQERIWMLCWCWLSWRFLSCNCYWSYLVSQSNWLHNYVCQLPHPMVLQDAEYHSTLDYQSWVHHALNSPAQCDLYHVAYRRTPEE